MKRSMMLFAVPMLVALFCPRIVLAHCEVPCGIYDDQLRFEQMLEDTETIQKAMDQMNSLAGKHDTVDLNQMIRWVSTKEQHATHTQHVIAQYFMTQRIKPADQQYVGRLKAAHAVMQAAMKCKQTADPANADALRKAIMNFHKVYEGK